MIFEYYWKHCSLLLLCFLVLVARGTAKAEIIPIRYADLETIAREKNSAIKGARFSYLSAKEQEGFLFRTFIPNVKAIGGYETFQTGRYSSTSEPYGSLESTVNLFNGFRDRLESNIRTAEVNHSLSQSALNAAQELAQIRELYRELSFYKELQKAWETVKDVNEGGFRSAQRRLDRGLVSETDLIEFKIYRGQIEEEIASVAHEKQLTSLKLSSMLGLPVTMDLDPVDPLNHVHDDALLKQDFSTQTTAGDMQLSATETLSQLKAQKFHSWWLPSLDAYGQYALYTLRDRDYLSMRDRNDWAVGVRMTWLIFDANGIADAKSASYARSAGENISTQRLRDYKTSIKVAQEELNHLHELIHLSEERTKEGLRYLQSTKSDYERGVKNSPDLISAIDKYVSFQKQELERKKNYYGQKEKLISLTVNPFDYESKN